MRTFKLPVFLAAIAISVASCRPQEIKRLMLPDVLPGEVIEFPGLLKTRDLIKSGNEFFALDEQAQKVFVYSEDGRFMHSFAEPGEGPGELHLPRHLAADEEYLFVVNVTGQVDTFTREGVYLKRNTDNFISTMNGNVVVLEGGKMFLGGRTWDGSDGGTFGHLLSLDSGDMQHFYPLSETSKTFGFDSSLNSQCDVDSERTLWCVQETEYTISQFNLDGRLLRELKVDAPDYRPITTQYPGPSNMPKMFEWGALSDNVYSVRVVDDERLLVEWIGPSPRAYWDLIDRDSGRVLAAFQSKELITYFDKEEGAIYLQEPAVEEAATRVRKVLLEDVLALK